MVHEVHRKVVSSEASATEEERKERERKLSLHCETIFSSVIVGCGPTQAAAEVNARVSG